MRPPRSVDAQVQRGYCNTLSLSVCLSVWLSDLKQPSAAMFVAPNSGKSMTQAWTGRSVGLSLSQCPSNVLLIVQI